MVCEKCGYKAELKFDACPACSYDLNTGMFRSMRKAYSKGLVDEKNTSSNINEKRIYDNQYSTSNINKRYPALRTLSGIYRILAYISITIGVIGILIGVSILSNGDTAFISFPIILISIIFAAIAGLTLLVIAEGIYVLIDIEYNTRISSVNMLRKELGNSDYTEKNK